MSYSIGEGFAAEIILKNGKRFYTGVGSIASHNAKFSGLKVETVRYRGCCIYANINSRALDPHYFPISINGVDIYTFINEIATDEEAHAELMK